GPALALAGPGGGSGVGGGRVGGLGRGGGGDHGGLLGLGRGLGEGDGVEAAVELGLGGEEGAAVDGGHGAVAVEVERLGVEELPVLLGEEVQVRAGGAAGGPHV